MTALAGVWNRRPGPDPEALCARLLAAQAIYGRHHGAQAGDGEAAMGRRLHRLLPEDIHDRQPLAADDGTLLVADVRLDNRRALGAELGIAGERLAGLCDAAVVLAAWNRWGEAVFDHLLGDYALAIWLPGARRLILARDPLGQRPLHYRAEEDRVVFATMPRPLADVGDDPAAADTARLTGFLGLRPEVGPRSFFEGVKRVEPGCLMIFEPDGQRRRRHFQPDLSEAPMRDPALCAADLRRLLEDAVQARTRRAGGALGTHLSAGLDSGAVTAAAARQAAESARIIAFTAAPRAGYRLPAPGGWLADESEAAARLASMFEHIEHVVVRPDDRSILDAADKAGALAGRPVLDAANQAWWDAISQAAAARGVSVLLTGDFGNLTLSADGLGYLADLVAGGRAGAWWTTARSLARGGLAWTTILAASLENALPPSLWNLARRASGRRAQRRSDHCALTAPARAALRRDAGSGQEEGLDPRLAALNRIDLACFGKAALAAYGVDLRHPAADRRLVEFALRLPPQVLLDGADPRGLGRRVLAGLLPTAGLKGRRRGWQAADWHDSLENVRQDCAAEIERLAVHAPTARLLDVPRLRRMVRRWPRGGWDREGVWLPYRAAFLRALTTGRFLRLAEGRNG